MMKQRIIHGLLAALLAWCPALLSAQRLTQVECWFDDNTRSKETFSISGTEFDLSTTLSTERLSPGIHRLHMRVVRTGGDYNYSPVSSTTFLKLPTGNSRVMEYWFDDEYAFRRSYALKADGELENLTIDMSDADLLPLGPHRLNMRVASADRDFSAVYSAMVVKMGTGQADQIEYWTDNDYEGRRRISCGQSTNTLTFFMDDLDLGSLPLGLHALHYRAVSSAGSACSAVHTATILKKGTGAYDKLEYWMDDDFDHRRSISCTSAANDSVSFVASLDFSGLPVGTYRLHYRAVSSTGNTASAIGTAALMVKTGGTPQLEYWIDDDHASAQRLEGTKQTGGYEAYHFDGELDLTSIAPGAHRLHYRPLMADGRAQGATGSVPFMAHSRYNSDASEAVVTGYSIWVDNEQTLYRDVLNPAANRYINHTLDAGGLSAGQHTVTTKVWNSFGVGYSEQDAFSVVTPDVPELTLASRVGDDGVRLSMNAVPNDVVYYVFRKPAGGTDVKVFTNMQSYPAGLTYTDRPAAGSYTYYAYAVYKAADGTKQVVKSNEVTAAVTAAAATPTVQYGIVSGRLTVDTQTPPTGVQVVFSDGVAVSVVNGLFQRRDVPCGRLTVTVTGDDAHEYDPQEVEVKAGANVVNLTGRLKEDVAENNLTNDLCFVSGSSWKLGQDLIFRVKNLTGKPWRGVLRVRIVRKGENPDGEQSTDAQANTGSMALLTPVTNYEVICTPEFEIEGTLGRITIPLADFKPKQTGYYDFYVESLRSEDMAMKLNLPYKMVAESAQTDVKNPLCYWMEKELAPDELTTEEEAEIMANWIVGLCSTVTDLDKKLGHLGEYADLIGTALGSQLSGANTTEKMDKRIESLIVDGRLKTDADMKSYSDRIAKHIADEAALGNLAIRNFRDNIKSGIKAAKDIKKYYGYVQTAIKAVNDYEAMQNMDGYEKFFFCAKKVVGLSKDPFSEIMQTYMDLGEKIIEKALAIGQNEYKPWIPKYISNFRPEREDLEGPNADKYQFNKHINFKIQITWPSGFLNKFTHTVDFSKYYNNPLDFITKVEVKVNNFEDKVATATFDLVGVSDGIMLKQTSIDNGGVRYNEGGTNGNMVPMVAPKRFWMEIYWTNGRVTKLPLLEEKGVKFHQENNLPSTFTIRFRSLSASAAAKNVADIIFLDE